MNIALDFDETITLDEYFWGAFIELAKGQHHSVTIVTSRHPSPGTDYNEDIEAYAKAWRVDIVYAGHKQKREVHKADVWIDDAPESIPTYHQLHTDYPI